MFLRIPILLCLPMALSYSAVVKTKSGTVEGKTKNNVHVFLGIPYAAPPIGDIRFASPQPVKPWNNTLQATTIPKGCLQAITEEAKHKQRFSSDFPESEDCLYLNIWAPAKKSTKKFAVMIWIHGGGFTSGSGSLPIYDGSVLASEQNVIVVTMNYRLSLFGFIYLNSSDAPGNAGLQDQIQAIRWLKDNIEYFGGDPERITLFGQSAGAISIGFHLTNPELDSLFHNVILESGAISIHMVTAPEELSLNITFGLARSVNCDLTTAQEIASCLRNKTPEELLASQRKLPKYYQVAFTPVRNGKEVPLVLNEILVPYNKRKNILGGNIPRELNYFVEDMFPEKKIDEHFTVSKDDTRDALKNGLGIHLKAFQDVLLHQYKEYDGTYNASQIRTEVTELVSDWNMICPQVAFTKSWVTTNNQVYYYYFKHSPSVREKEHLPKWMKATHGDEINFVFGRPLDPQKGYTQKEKKLSTSIMTFWGNFAKTGNPNGQSRGGVTWPAVSAQGPLRYLEINDGVTAKRFLKERECDFWINIFPDLAKIQGQHLKASK